MSAFAERRWTSSDGLSLYTRDYPAAGGPARLPVICLHGLTRNGRDFEEVAPLIASSGRRVLVPDMRGRGHSQWDPQPEHYTPATYAADVLALLEASGMDQAIFVGTSMGGIIAMAIAAVRPAAIAAAVLNDVGPVVAPEGIERIKSYVGGEQAITSWDEAKAYARRTNGSAFPGYDDEDWARFARRLFREKDGVPRLDYDPGIALQLQNDDYKAPDEEAWRLFEVLVTGRPTLLVRGELSDLLSEEIAERMQEVAPALQRVDVPHVGHAPMLSEPEAIQAIGAFLAELP